MTTRVTSTTLHVVGTTAGAPSPLPAFTPVRALPPVEIPDADEAMSARARYGRLSSPLPYARQSDYTRHDDDLGLDAVVLENEHLRATVLPGLGGRVWSLRDLQRDRELLHVNPALRFANFGLTDAWFAGGIEWNLGSTGHTTLSSRPMHAARIATASGEGLRLWEWERTRDLILQIDLTLDGDRLYASTRVINPDPEPAPLYWWTNIAVPETEGTRVLSIADHAWRTDYDGVLALVPIPHPDSPDVDISIPASATASADYFFTSPAPGRFVAAVEPDGRGFAQTSTDELTGRKLFEWGRAAGGLRWQEWLSGPGSFYTEIQAGWCTTQMEHDELPGGAVVSWTEAFGAIDLDPAAVAAPFAEAAQAAQRAVWAAAPPTDLAQRHQRWLTEIADAAPAEMLHTGSGWGAVELRLRAHASAPRDAPVILDSVAPALPFPDVEDDSTVAGAFLDDEPEVPADAAARLPVPPISRRWQRAFADDRWDGVAWVRHARAVAAHHEGQHGRARSQYQAALALDPEYVVALRGAALLADACGTPEEAVAGYRRAVELAPQVRILLTELVELLLRLGRPREAIDAIGAAPPHVREHGRHRLLLARARLAVDDRDAAARILEDLEVPDLAEGGREITDLWDAVHPGIPLPPRLDFRMT